MNDGNPGDHGGGSMRLWSRLRSWWNATLWRSRMESQMDAELRFHMEAYAEDLIQSGVPSREGLRRAREGFPRRHAALNQVFRVSLHVKASRKKNRPKLH